MSNYELYEKVINAYKSGDENLFNASARNWIEGADIAPFENSEAVGLFGAAKHHYALWKSNGISSRVSKLRMINDVSKIAEMDLPNPYKEAKKRKEEHKEEPMHVLGVVPDKTVESLAEEPKHFFSRRKKR